MATLLKICPVYDASAAGLHRRISPDYTSVEVLHLSSRNTYTVSIEIKTVFIFRNIIYDFLKNHGNVANSLWDVIKDTLFEIFHQGQ